MRRKQQKAKVFSVRPLGFSLQLLAFSLALLTGCSGPYMGKDLFGADEFVLDSYKIREGKLSILEMEGMAVSELDESLLDEYKDTIHEDDVLVVLVLNHKRPDVVEEDRFLRRCHLADDAAAERPRVAGVNLRRLRARDGVADECGALRVHHHQRDELPLELARQRVGYALHHRTQLEVRRGDARDLVDRFELELHA